MNQDDDTLSDTYDFSKGERGKYASRVKPRPTPRLIDPELAKHFPTDQAVNDALRELLDRRSQKSNRQ